MKLFLLIWFSGVLGTMTLSFLAVWKYPEIKLTFMHQWLLIFFWPLLVMFITYNGYIFFRLWLSTRMLWKQYTRALSLCKTRAEVVIVRDAALRKNEKIFDYWEQLKWKTKTKQS